VTKKYAELLAYDENTVDREGWRALVIPYSQKARIIRALTYAMERMEAEVQKLEEALDRHRDSTGWD
jgi:hypothetical protein